MTTEPAEAPRRLPRRERLRNRRQTSRAGYDAFISYSRADVEFATRLQRSLERFAKPWNRARALRVFRDMSSLAPESDLRTSIERQMERSAWFILLLSPEAGESKWVNREIRWWLDEKSAERMLIVVTDGALAWDERADDFSGSAAVAPELRGGFAEEPSWIDAGWARSAAADDPRLQDVTAGLTSAIKDVPKDELFAAAVREHRRTMRLATTGLLSLAALLILAAVAGVIAYTQRNTAREQATLAVSRQLAAVSAGELTSNLDVSLLLAVEAVRRDDNPQARSALMAAAFASPHLVRYFDLPGRVTAVAGSADGRVLAAGLADGRVMRWGLAGLAPREIARLPNAITEVALNATGAAAVATDGSPDTETSSAVLVRGAGASQPLTLPERRQPTSVGISPSGRTVLLSGAARAGGAAAVFDGRTGKPSALHKLSSDLRWPDLVVPSDAEVVLLNGGSNAERRDLESWATIDRGGVGLGARESPGAPSADGEFVTGTNGLPTIPVWTTRSARDHERPDLTAEAPITGVGPLALSPDGTRLAIADTGVIYVAATAKPGTARLAPVALDGNGNVDHVRFLGGGSQLVSVSGTKVVWWNLEQPDRLARSLPVPIPDGCTACPGPRVAVSRDGRRAAIADGAGRGAVLADLRTGRSDRLSGDAFDFEYLQPVFGRDGTAAFPIAPTFGDAETPPPDDLPVHAATWMVGDGAVAAGAAESGDLAVIVGGDGKISLHRIRDGSLTRSIDPRRAVERLDDAAVAPSGDRVATLFRGRISIVGLAEGSAVTRFTVPGATRLALGGDRVFVQKDDGSLEVRTGARLERTLTGDPSYVWPPMPNPQGTLVARRRANGKITLVDADTGSTLLTLPHNPGAGGMKIGVVFSPDGRRLVTVTEAALPDSQATMIVRDLSLPELTRSACRTAGHELSPAEWRRFAGLEAPEQPACDAVHP